MKTRILVTGASGFLGVNFLHSLKEDTGYDITAIARHADDESGVIPVDLIDFDAVRSVISDVRPDIVFHLGAEVDLSRSFAVARKTAESNIIGTLHLLAALAMYPVKRIVFASTEEVYGQGSLPYSETQEPQPPSPYAVTKLTGEHLMRLYTGKSAAQSLVLRIGTMYGPHQPSHRFICQMIEKALNNEDILLNSGNKKRDYIYVGDVVAALRKAEKARLERPFDVINIGGGHAISLSDFAHELVSAAGSRSRLRLGVVPDRIGEAQEWRLDITKAEHVLGWKPVTDITNGLIKTIDHYRAH